LAVREDAIPPRSKIRQPSCFAASYPVPSKSSLDLMDFFGVSVLVDVAQIGL
jgi:hypothetical protein